MQNTVASISADTLDRLGINYRALPCGSGAFYYCKIPASGCTFDLQCDGHDKIRLWRFIGTAPIARAGNRYEYRDPCCPCAAVGMEVTNEGDVSFYAEQKIDITNSHSAARIHKMIRGYIHMIAAPFPLFPLCEPAVYGRLHEDTVQ